MPAQPPPLIKVKVYKPNDSTFMVRKNVIKIEPVLDVMALFTEVKKFEIAYERVLTKKHTISLIFQDGIYLNADIPATRVTTMGITNTAYYVKEVYKSTGYSLLPEYRYYFYNRRNRFPRGFYIGASLIYYHLNYSYELRNEYQDVLQSEKSINNVYGVGGVFGWQGMLKNGFTFNAGLIFNYTFNTYTNNSEVFQKNYDVFFLKNSLIPRGDLTIGYAFGKVMLKRYDKNKSFKNKKI